MSDIIYCGFTGTRKGMTLFQKQRLISYLTQFKNNDTQLVWHHGCCEGADVEFDGIVRKFYPNGHLHPSNISKTQVVCLWMVTFFINLNLHWHVIVIL
jgi:hypothetical protein